MKKDGFVVMVITLFFAWNLTVNAAPPVSPPDLPAQASSRARVVIEKVWERKFDKDVGVFSPDGKAVILGALVDRGKIEHKADTFAVVDDAGKVVWSRKINNDFEVAVTPTWERISIQVPLKHEEEKEGQPLQKMEIYDRKGLLIASRIMGENRQDYGCPIMNEGTFMWEYVDEDGPSGEYEIFDFGGRSIKKLNIGMVHRQSTLDGLGYLFWGPESILILDSRGEEIFSTRVQGHMFGVSMDGDYLLTAGWISGKGETAVGKYYLFHIPSRREVLTFQDTRMMGDLAVSPDGKQVAIVTAGKNLYFYNLNPTELLGKFDISKDWVPIFELTEGFASESIRSPYTGRLHFDGKKVRVLGRKFMLGFQPLEEACWDLQGQLLWKEVVAERAIGGRFVDKVNSDVLVQAGKVLSRKRVRELGP